MARIGPVGKAGFALALILLIGKQDHATATDEKCRSGCQGTPQYFKYAEGTTYKYNLEGNIDISLSSAENQQTGTKLRATVLVTQLPQCNQLIRLQNVQVIGPDSKKYGQIPDLEKPIRINFHDGHVEDIICAEPGDSYTSLNIKRAVASLFQAAIKHNHETDVFGLCPTQITTTMEGGNYVIHKSRNLNRCAHRENIKHDFLATTFNLNSEIKSSPILNADYISEQRLKNGILDHAIITENYLYVPFSVGKNGAKATVQTKIQYVGTSKDTPKTKVSEARSIIFENPHPVEAPKTNVDSILNAVKETTKTTDINENTAEQFANLIRILTVAKKDDLLAVYNQVKAGVGFKDKSSAKRVFLDALLRAGTGSTTEVAIELLKNHELDLIEQKLVYLGLAFVRHATEASLNSASTLLDQPNLPREAYLGIGTLGGRYCKQHSCKNVDAINKLVQKLVSKLGDGKATDRQHENIIISVLKALGNVHHLNEGILSKLTSIAQDKKASNRIRVAALETYLTDACKDKLRDSALSILKDIQQDSEVRIKAYLVVAQCPNGKIANSIKSLLDKEPSYQVGGFIVSHLRNIRASANPDKELAKQHLSQIHLPRHFPFDLRKYSFNGEFSYAIDSLGAANSIESNVIYSQNSFLPRSTSLNLTTEIFGHTFNFLEINARQENLDRLMEHYFGPLGVFKSSTPEQLLNTGKEAAEKILTQVDDRLRKTARNKRDVSTSEIDGIAKKVQIQTNELNKDLDLDLGIKVFGSELLFLSLNEDHKQYSPEVIINKIFDTIDKGIDHVKDMEHVFRSNALFLDGEFSYPTSLGFPLRLSVEGSAAIQIRAATKVDPVNFFYPHYDGIFKFFLVPSANIEVAGRLTLDAYVVENGLKVSSNLYSSTGGDITMEYFNKLNGLDVKFKFPLEKQKLISANHQIVFITREHGLQEINQPIKFSQNKDFSICLDQLSPLIGLTVCGEMNGPNLAGKQVPVLPFPFSGNAKYAVILEREDVSSFHYRSNIFYGQDPKAGIEILFETLGEKNDRKVAIEFEQFTRPEMYIKASLTSPIKSVSLDGRVIYTTTEASLTGTFINDGNEYYGKIGVATGGAPGRTIYKPIFEYRTPGDKASKKPPYNVEGAIILETKQNLHKYSFDNVKVTLPNQKQVTVTGNLGRENDAFFSDLTLNDGTHSGSFKGRLQANPNLFKFNAEVQNSYNPDINVNVKGELKKQPGQIDSSFQIITGKDLSNKKNMLSFSNTIISQVRSAHDFHVGTKNKFTYPLIGVNSKFNFAQTQNSLLYDILIQYNEIKFGSEMDLKYARKIVGDYDLDFNLFYGSERIAVNAKRDIIGDKSKISNSLEALGKKFEVSGMLEHRIKSQDAKVGADLIVKIPQHPNPIKVVANLFYNPTDVDSSLKITSGASVYADIFFKANDAGNANGNIKVNTEHLVANGQVKATKGTGNADIVIHVVKGDRKLKGETTFTISDPTYNVVVVIHPNFEKDTKKITVSTHNKITPTSINSKNSVDVFGHKLEGNIQGSLQGELNNGKLNGEFDITLPSNHYLAGKINRDVKLENGIGHGNVLVSLEQRDNKNSPGRKISLKGTGKNINVNEALYDVSYELNAENNNGKTINIDVNSKRIPEGDKIHSDLNIKVHGTVLPHPFETGAQATYKNKIGTYHVFLNYSPKTTLSVDGKYDFYGDNTPYSGQISVDLKTPNSALQVLKFNADGSVLKNNEVFQIGGSTSIFVDDDGTKKDATVDVKVSGDIKLSKHDGNVQGSLQYKNEAPITVSAGYGHTEEGNDVGKCHCHFALQYAQNKNLKTDITVQRLSKNEYKIDVGLVTPHEKAKNVQLNFHGKRSEDQIVSNADGSLTVNDQKYEFTHEMSRSSVSPSLKITLKYPNGKVDEFAWRTNKISNRQFTEELKIVYHPKDIFLDSKFDIKAESIDDFHINIYLDVNTPQLQIGKALVEIFNKPSQKGTKRIQFSVKGDDKVVLSGSTNYKTRVEGDKWIVEGSGSFQYKEESKSCNFKYIKQDLSLEKNGESGTEISFNAAVGKKAVDAEIKVTNKQFRLLNSYCEETKQCAYVEIDVKTTINDAAEYNNVLEISVDLRKLGLSHEFGLKAVTNRKQFVLDHTVDVHFQSPENSKYQYSVYIHPTEAGVSLTTPKRIISLEAVAKLPGKDGKFIPINGEIVFYMDKINQPNQKTALTSSLKYDGKSNAYVGEVKLTNPGLNRPLVVSFTSSSKDNSLCGELLFDVFAKSNKKIIATACTTFTKTKNLEITTYENKFNLKSEGLNVAIDAKQLLSLDLQKYTGKYSEHYNWKFPGVQNNFIFTLEGSPRQISLLLRLHNKDLLKILSKLQFSKEHQVIDTEYVNFGGKPLVFHTELKNFNTFKHTAGYKDTPNDKLQLSAGLIVGQIADLRAEIIKGGNKIDLVHATVKLDDANFLKSDYGFNAEAIQKKLLAPVKDNFVRNAKEFSNLNEQEYKKTINGLKELTNHATKSVPNFIPVREYYTAEGHKLREEIVSDKTIKDIGEFLKGIFGVVLDTMNEVLGKVNDLIEKVAGTIQTNFSKVLKTIELDLIPKITEVVEKFVKLGVDIFDEVTNVIFAYLAKLSEFMESHQAEIKQIATSISSIAQDVGRFLMITYEQLREVLVKQFNQIYSEIKALPIYEEIKTKYEQLVKEGFVAPEPLLTAFHEAVATLKDGAPTPELKNLIRVTADYIEKKLKGENVNDLVAIEKIFQGVLTVIRQWFSSVRHSILNSDYDSPTIRPTPVSVDFLYRIPRIVAAKFSPISYLLAGDYPRMINYIYGVTLNPKEWFPPHPLHGLIVQGQHIFTFDGKHLTFPGKCNYLLAQDALDGNFSVVGTYTNGIMTAITLSDKSTTVTIKKGGQLFLNNAAHEFPVRKDHLEAYRLYESLHLYSKAGVEVICGPELVACGIHISGYYHGRVRGLLGNGNNEPYDDYTMPNGKIVTSESDFGNAYKLASGCPVVKTVDHHAHHPVPECDKLFSSDSRMSLCYVFVNPTNFKTACEHGIAAGVKDTQHAIAVGYVAACRSRFVPIKVPKQFVQCTNGPKPTNLGDTFSVKLPGKAADILILVDQTKSNEPVYKELVQPLVQQLTADLTAKGISDIDFHLITYGGEYQKWPSHVTVNGKLTFRGKSPNIKFSEPPKHFELRTGSDKIDAVVKELHSILHDWNLAIGNTIAAKTYSRAMKYPFRAHAVKSIIVVSGNKCEVGRFFPIQFLHALAFVDESISLNLITPFEDLELKDAKQAKEVIGFNDRNVFTFGNSKKKLDGSSEQYDDLDYTDFCVDFTIENRGNVYVTNNFLQAKGGNKKQYVQVASHNIVDQLVNIEQGMDCECEYVSGYSAENVCSESYSKEKASKKGGTKS